MSDMSEETKKCIKGEGVFPITFYRKAKKGKRRNVCNSCMRQYYLDYGSGRKDEIARQKQEKRQMREQGLKLCGKCNIVKPVSEFHKSAERWDGLVAFCMPCCSHKQEKYYGQNADRLKEKTRQWNLKNPDKKADYYHNKGGRQKAYECRKKHSKELAQKKTFRMNNDPKFKLDFTISARIRTCLKSQGGSKAGKQWESCVGYSLQDLHSHLESLFDDSMTWENFGSYWNIDHFFPKIWYKYNSTEDGEFKKCWSLKNLQPLSQKENSSKGSRYAGTPTSRILKKDLYNDDRVKEEMRGLRPDKDNNRVFGQQEGVARSPVVLQGLCANSSEEVPSGEEASQREVQGVHPTLPFQEQR